MASKFAFVTAASTNYLPGLYAFFNSLVMNKHKDDVVLGSFRLPEDFLESLNTLPFHTEVVNIDTTGNQSEDTAIGRFKMAYDYGQKYEAICLVEGDLFLTGNVSTFFNIASKGFVVVASNGMVVNFGRDYQKQYGIDLGVDQYIYPKVHTTVPIFIGMNDLDWFKKFHDGRMSAHSFDDVFGLNVLGISMGKSDRILCLPPYQWTGIHHFGVKPETGWMEKDGFVLSGTEEQVYMIHGKWWDEGWRSDLPLTMGRYFQREGMTGKSTQRVQNSIDTGYRLFLRYNNGNKLKS